MKNKIKYMKGILAIFIFSCCALCFSPVFSQKGRTQAAGKKVLEKSKTIKITLSEYEDRVHAIWVAQMVAATMGFPFEHRTASVEWVSKLPDNIQFANVDDDWYYEMAAIRAFEKYGTKMTVQQLGKQWIENSCGTWGSSEQARLLMQKGIFPPESGHPRYNKLWFTIGPQFSCDVYGALAPGLPNVAAKMAREYGNLNGYAEGTDGGVFVAGMISIAFSEKDPAQVVRKAAQLISPLSPYRKCIDQVIRMAEEGKSSGEIFNSVEDRWHMEYPATNNAVANGGIVAASVWFGEADFLKTINLAFGAADYEDADCNAANAGAVIAAMHGTKCIPDNLLKGLNDRIKGEKMGGVVLTPAVDESITALAKRTAAIGQKILLENGVKLNGNELDIAVQMPVTQKADLFKLADLTQFWNPEWKLERAGFGGAGGGMGGIRGNTFLDGDVLATYPRDEIRSLVLHRSLKVNGQKELTFDVGVDAKRVWELNVFINNKRLVNKKIEGNNDQAQKWESISVDITPYDTQTITIRLYQRVLVPGKEAGNAYWKNIKIQ
ncbi:MAG: ADP-ribosylglycohydrolase family protein [Ginsengibacter sp.]